MEVAAEVLEELCPGAREVPEEPVDNKEQEAQEELMEEEEEEEDEPDRDMGCAMENGTPLLSRLDVINSRNSLNVFSLKEDDLDKLEGIHIDFDTDNFQDDLPGTAVDTDEKVVKAKDALVGKGPRWQSYGAGKMVVQIIEKGLRLNFILYRQRAHGRRTSYLLPVPVQ